MSDEEFFDCETHSDDNVDISYDEDACITYSIPSSVESDDGVTLPEPIERLQADAEPLFYGSLGVNRNKSNRWIDSDKDAFNAQRKWFATLVTSKDDQNKSSPRKHRRKRSRKRRQFFKYIYTIRQRRS